MYVYYICMFGWIDHRFTNLQMWVCNNNSQTPSNLPLNPQASLWLQILEQSKWLLDDSKPKPPNLWFAWHSHYETLAIAEEATILTLYSIQLSYIPPWYQLPRCLHAGLDAKLYYDWADFKIYNLENHGIILWKVLTVCSMLRPEKNCYCIWIRDLMILPQQLQQLIRLHPLSLSKKPSLTMKNPRNLRRFPRTRLLPCSVKSFPSSIVKACRRTSRAASWCLKVSPKRLRFSPWEKNIKNMT